MQKILPYLFVASNQANIYYAEKILYFKFCKFKELLLTSIILLAYLFENESRKTNLSFYVASCQSLLDYFKFYENFSIILLT